MRNCKCERVLKEIWKKERGRGGGKKVFVKFHTSYYVYLLLYFIDNIFVIVSLFIFYW